MIILCGLYLQNNVAVEVPGTFHLHQCSSAAQEAPVYDLSATVHHAGTMTGGHYWAQCRSPADGKVYACNDSTVRLDAITSDPSRTAFVLFYKLRDA